MREGRSEAVGQAYFAAFQRLRAQLEILIFLLATSRRLGGQINEPPPHRISQDPPSVPLWEPHSPIVRQRQGVAYAAAARILTTHMRTSATRPVEMPPPTKAAKWSAGVVVEYVTEGSAEGCGEAETPELPKHCW